MTKSFEVNKALIREMAEICQDRKIRFVLMVLPIESYMPEEEKLLKDINPTFDPNRIEEDLRRYAGTRGIDFIGLQRVFAARYRETGTPLHWIHLNYKGHQLTADILAEKLEEILCTNDKKGKAAGPVASKTRPRKSTGTK